MSTCSSTARGSTPSFCNVAHCVPTTSLYCTPPAAGLASPWPSSRGSCRRPGPAACSPAPSVPYKSTTIVLKAMAKQNDIVVKRIMWEGGVVPVRIKLKVVRLKSRSEYISGIVDQPGDVAHLPVEKGLQRADDALAPRPDVFLSGQPHDQDQSSVFRLFGGLVGWLVEWLVGSQVSFSSSPSFCSVWPTRTSAAPYGVPVPNSLPASAI